MNPTGIGGPRKGETRNPGGRPKTVAKVRKLARVHTEAAIDTLAEIMQDGDQHPAARVAAAKELLDRGHGKPMQAHEVTRKDGLIDLEPMTSEQARARLRWIDEQLALASGERTALPSGEHH